MATFEALPAQPIPVEDVSIATSAPEDPKAALAKGVALDDENEDQILFSCNICYDVSCLWDIILYYFECIHANLHLFTYFLNSYS
jgi:hypothetical protein